MFQYAAGRALSIRNDMELVLDTTSGFLRDNIYRRSFSLGAFPIRAKRASLMEQLPFWFERGLQKFAPSELKPINYRPWGNYLFESAKRVFPEIVNYHLAGRAWIEGYWASEEYFHNYTDVIGCELAVPEPLEGNFLSIAKLIQSCDSVAVGVRVYEDIPGIDKSGVGGLTPISFYEEAANCVTNQVKNPIFFVFSSTIAAVKDKLRLPGRIYYLTKDNGYSATLQTLWLISRCRHHIISNSSFYWWGAWLAEHNNPASTIIAPDLFPNPASIPERWTLLAVV